VLCCVVFSSWVKTNDQKLPGHDPAKPTKHIRYYDVNNLYGYAMTMALPYKSFEWMSGEECAALHDEIKLHWSTRYACGKSYFFEVDIDYPAHLHEAHNDFPLCPERMTVYDEQLSETQHDIYRQYTKDCFNPTAKLVANLMPKKKYVLHASMLHEVLSRGLVVTKWHRGIKFEQKDFMRQYIEFNNMMRARVIEGDEFERDLWKLLNNAVRFLFYFLLFHTASYFF